MTETTKTAENLAKDAVKNTEELAKSGSEKVTDLLRSGAETVEGLAACSAEGPQAVKGEEAIQGVAEEAEQAASDREFSVSGEKATKEGAIEAGSGLISYTVGGEIRGEAQQTLAATPFEERAFGECLAQVEIPPQFQTVTEQVLNPDTGEYQTVTKKAMISEGRTEERAIVCEADIKRDLVMKIQNTLAEEGFDPGPVDGTIGPMTMGALNGYQKANNLPVDKHLNVATIKA